MEKPVLSVKNLRKVFYTKKFLRKKEEDFVAVDNISFNLNKGEILGFLGPNGSGKTTTIQMLLGLMTPTSGKIEYFGENFLSEQKEILKKVTFASSYVQLPGSLTVYENLDIFGRLYDIPTLELKERITYFLKAFGIWELRNKSTGVLSAGQMALVMLTKAFLPNPQIVLLDEPTAALDPEVALEVRKFILNQQAEHKISILLTSHNMAEVSDACDRILVLKEGKLIADSEPDLLTKTVSISHLRLVVDDKIVEIENFIRKFNVVYRVKGKSFEIDIDEHMIPALLHGLALAGLNYIGISIDKPSLEDYFLSISKKS